MVRKDFVLILALIFLTLVGFSIASATTLFVATTGNDGNVCDTDNKCLTIQRAIDVATEGDIIIVAAGNYPENITINESSLTLKSAGGSSATNISGSINITDPGHNFVLGGTNGVGFTIQGSSDATDTTSDDTFALISIRGIPTTTLMENITIAYNTFDIKANFSTNVFGILIKDANITNLNITGNSFFLNDSEQTAIAADEQVDVIDTNIISNIFLGNGTITGTPGPYFQRGIAITIPNINASGKPFVIEGNSFVGLTQAIVIGNASDGSGLRSGGSFLLINNNTFENNNISIDIVSANDPSNESILVGGGVNISAALQDIRISNNIFNNSYITAIAINSSLYTTYNAYPSFLDPTDFTIINNTFLRNTLAIMNNNTFLSNNGVPLAVNAERNYWGGNDTVQNESSGPGGALLGGEFTLDGGGLGSGDNVTRYVDYSPWCLGYNATGNAAQDNSAEENCAFTNNTQVDAEGTIPGAFPQIHSAISNGSIGDIIEVHRGNYTEDIFINISSITLKALWDKAVTLINGSITLGAEADNFILGGENGYGFTVMNSSMGGSNPSLIMIGGTDNVTISFNDINITINNSFGIAIIEMNLTNLVINNNSFDLDGLDQFGISSPDTVEVTGLTVTDNTFKGLTAYGENGTTNGVAITTFNTNNSAYPSTINRNTFTGITRGIVIGNVSEGIDVGLVGGETYILIDSNTFEYNNISIDIINVNSPLNTSNQDIRITNNNFSRSLYAAIAFNTSTFINAGVSELNPSNFTAYNNTFWSNVVGVNSTALASINMSSNWWGNDTGPSGQANGGGDIISSLVIFEPWCDSLTCTNLTNASYVAPDTTTTTTSSSTSGGSLAATTDVVKKTITTTTEEFTAGVTKEVGAQERVKFSVDGKEHQVYVNEVTSTSAKIKVSSTPQEATLNIGDEKKFEVTNDTFYDVYVKLNSITSNKASLTIKSIHEEIKAEEAPVEEEEKKISEAIEEFKKEQPWLFWTIVIVIIVVIVAIVAYILYKKKRYFKKGY